MVVAVAAADQIDPPVLADFAKCASSFAQPPMRAPNAPSNSSPRPGSKPPLLGLQMVLDGLADVARPELLVRDTQCVHRPGVQMVRSEVRDVRTESTVASPGKQSLVSTM